MQLILPLLLLVVITPTVAFATNESSYKFGYKAAYEGYKCHADENDCGAPSSNIEEQCSDQVTHGAVDNQTACQDGWVTGWKDWCKTDVNYCLENVPYGYFPDVHGVLKSNT